MIGVFFFAFASYTGVLALVTGLMSKTNRIPRSHYAVMLFALIILLSAIPLMSSRKTLYEGITGSRILSRILPAIGFRVDNLNYSGSVGRSLIALILGVVFGAATYFVSPLILVGAIAGLICVYLVMAKPEFGMLCLILIAPIVPTGIDAGLIIFVAFSYVIKLMRGKRRIAFETVDLFVLIFAVLYIFGGFISLSIKSLFPVSMRLCFLTGYFLIACVEHSRDWLKRFAMSALFSAVIVSVYGILMYFFGSKGGNTWLDSSMFSDISGRAISTLENPNMLGTFLAMMIPIAVSALISGELVKRSVAFLICCAPALCMILTWSRGAWLGMIFGMLILMFIWHRRALWIFIGGIIALPLATFAMPKQILSRFISIGNMADSSTSYRVYIWRGAIRIIRDHLFTGIGVGEDAWKKIYPKYTLPGIEKAPHAHNLFMQVTVDMGLAALIVFLAIMFFTLQSGFSVFKKMSGPVALDRNNLIRPDELDLSDRKLTDLSKLRLRMAVAGPMCGILSVLVEGWTDYSWYNYRVFLIFWMTVGLTVAFTKNARKCLRDDESFDCDEGALDAEVELRT